MKKLLLGVCLLLVWPAGAGAAPGLPGPVARTAITRYEKGPGGAIDYCRRYGPRWVHCKVTEPLGDGWFFRYGIDVKLRGEKLVLSSFAFAGPLAVY